MRNFSLIVIPQHDGDGFMLCPDNYCYYVYKEEDIQEGYFIDACNMQRVNEFRAEFQITKPPKHIISTHRSNYHSGANLAIKEAFSDVEIMGNAAGLIPGVTRFVEDGDRIGIFDDEVWIECFAGAGGHMMFYFEADECEDGEEHESNAIF